MRKHLPVGLVSLVEDCKLPVPLETAAVHARRLKLSVLNVTSVSDGRMDAFAPGSGCAQYCYPGLPHHWAEMMLRMLEQQVNTI